MEHQGWKFDAKASRVTDMKGKDVAFIAGGPTPESLHNGYLIAAVPDMVNILEASRHLFKSYEYHNAATEPAKDMAERIENILKAVGVKVKF